MKEENDTHTVAWYALQVQRTEQWDTLTINTRRKVLDIGKQQDTDVQMPRDVGIIAGRYHMDKTKLVAGANYSKYKLKYNCCTTEREFMNFAEPPNGGEDHQHDFETDSLMTTS